MGLLKTAATVAVASSRARPDSTAAASAVGCADQAPAGEPAAAPARYPAAPVQPQQAYAEPVPAPQAPAPASAAPADMSDRLARSKQLGELLSAGVLTQAEFDQQKARILNS